MSTPPAPANSGPPTAADLRRLFKAVPQADRDGHQAWAIRVWRSLSWLERAEQAGDAEGRFINAWIAFNALYGRLDDNNRPTSERLAYREFLRTVADLDADGGLTRLLATRWFQTSAARLVADRYLDERFWLAPDTYSDEQAGRTDRRFSIDLAHHRVSPCLKELVDRLYIMRQQIFHGAATQGSRLNRTTLDRSSRLLLALLPLVLEAVIRYGIPHNWPAVAFPPEEGQG
ncbi:MAG: hypothetical protein GXY55_03010 [Phycisphaerae bacterium]|nr:hypothetical protein [Phycisphaerae bacterium]